MNGTPRDSNAHQPLLWWSTAELAALSCRIEATLRDWLQQWSVVGPRTLPVCSTLAWEDADPVGRPWSVLGAHSSQQAWVYVDTLGPCVGDWLFNRRALDRAAVLAPALTGKAGRHLLRALRETLLLDTTAAANAPDRQVLQPWSGAVRLCIGSQDSDSKLQILLNGATAAAVIRPRARELAAPRLAPVPLTSLSEACAGQSVRLDVRLAPSELELGALRNLQRGDIVPLPHALDVPLHVNFEGKPICGGFLGRFGNAAAIELIRGCTPPSTQA